MAIDRKLKQTPSIGKVALAVAGATLLMTGPALAANYMSVTDISSSLDSTAKVLVSILGNIALITGIGFLMAAFFKLHQHRQNPNQVPISQGIGLLIIGGGMILIPILIPTISDVIYGGKSPSSAPAFGRPAPVVYPVGGG